MILSIVTSPKDPSRPRSGRYSLDRAIQEISRKILSEPRGTHSRVAEHLEIRPQQLTHRLSGAYKMSVAEIGIIADYFGAPAGWPFIPWEEAAERDEAWKNRKRR